MNGIRPLLRMARKNVRRAWARNLALALVLTLGVGGDILLGMFFTGLEARTANLAPALPQHVAMQVMAPGGTNVNSWLTWSQFTGSFGGARNYTAYYGFRWEECFTEAGRSTVLSVAFNVPFLQGLLSEGRWPYELDEVALPATLAQRLGAGPGDTVRMAVGDPRAVRYYRVTGLFLPVVFRAGGRYQSLDQSLNYPLVSLIDPSTGKPVGEVNGAWIDLNPSQAARLEARMRTYFDRQYPAQPALARFSLVEPVFVHENSGADQARSIGYRLFAPGRRALGAGLLFVGLGVFVILLIAFIERKRELAVLKTVGMNNRMVLSMVLLELGLVAGTAVAAGSVLAWVAGRQVARFVEYIPEPTLQAWLWALGHIVAVLVIATALPLSMMRLATVQQLLQNQALHIIRKRVTLS